MMGGNAVPVDSGNIAAQLPASPPGTPPMEAKDADDPVGEVADSKVDWFGIAEPVEDGDLETAPTPPVVAKEEAPPVAPVTPTPTPAPVVAAVEPPVVLPPQAQQPVVAAPVVPPALAQADLDKQRADYVTMLEGRYKLNEEDAGKLVLQPNDVIPRLAANLHANIVQDAIQTVMAAVQQVLPSLVDRQTTQRTESQKAEDSFFTQWPELKSHRELVLQTGRVFRTQNPSASMEDFIRQVGMHTWMGAKLPIADLAARLDGKGNGAQPAQQPLPSAPTVGYRPASPAYGASPPTPTNDNPFSQLAEEMLREDFF